MRRIGFGELVGSDGSGLIGTSSMVITKLKAGDR